MKKITWKVSLQILQILRRDVLRKKRIRRAKGRSDPVNSLALPPSMSAEDTTFLNSLASQSELKDRAIQQFEAQHTNAERTKKRRIQIGEGHGDGASNRKAAWLCPPWWKCPQSHFLTSAPCLTRCAGAAFCPIRLFSIPTPNLRGHLWLIWPILLLSGSSKQPATNIYSFFFYSDSRLAALRVSVTIWGRTRTTSTSFETTAIHKSTKRTTISRN